MLFFGSYSQLSTRSAGDGHHGLRKGYNYVSVLDTIFLSHLLTGSGASLHAHGATISSIAMPCMACCGGRR